MVDAIPLRHQATVGAVEERTTTHLPAQAPGAEGLPVAREQPRYANMDDLRRALGVGANHAPARPQPETQLPHFQHPDQLVAFLRQNGGTSIPMRSEGGRYLIGPVKYHHNGRAFETELVFHYNTERGWLCFVDAPAQDQNRRLAIQVSRASIDSIYFDPHDLVPTPAPAPRPVIGQALAAYQAGRLHPARVIFWGAENIEGRYVPAPGPERIETFQGSFQVRGRHFSTDPTDPGAYIAIVNNHGETILGRIDRIWRPQGSANETPHIDIAVPGELQVHRFSWNNLLTARPDAGAKTLFDRLRQPRNAEAQVGRPVARPAGAFDPARARAYQGGVQAHQLNERTLATLQTDHQLQEGRDFRVAYNRDGSRVAPFSIEHGEYANPRNQISQGTAMGIVPRLRGVDIFEIIPGQFSVRHPDPQATPFTPALRHPEFMDMLHIAQRQGVRVVIDPTVDINHAGGFYSPHHNMIRIPPDMPLHGMRHELQHAIFYQSGLQGLVTGLMSNPQFWSALRSNNLAEANRLFGLAIPRHSVRAAAEGASMPPDNYYNLLQQHLMYGLGTSPRPGFPYHPTTAINETMSVAAEVNSFDRAGIARTDPRYIHASNYALEWQRDFLQALPQNELLTTQRQLLDRALVRVGRRNP